jgi:hypothetical protein
MLIPTDNFKGPSCPYCKSLQLGIDDTGDSSFLFDRPGRRMRERTGVWEIKTKRGVYELRGRIDRENVWTGRGLYEWSDRRRMFLKIGVEEWTRRAWKWNIM